jgi:fructokinase
VAEQRGSRVVVIGDALIDEIRDASGSRDVVGGAALNVAVGLGLLGVPTTLVAMVGDDEDGATVRDYLARHAVRLVATPAPLGTARATAMITPTGEAWYEFNDAAINRTIDFSGEARQAIAAAPLVVVSCYPFDSDAKTDALLAAVDDSAARLVVDPNPRPALMSDLDGFVRNVDRVAAAARLLKIGDDDAELLYGASLEDAAERLHRAGAAFVLATAGRRGAVLLTPAGRLEAGIAELPGPIIDTIGAGDATLAAMTDALLRADLKGASDLDHFSGALQNAMIIAAATVRSEGALLRLP